MDTTLATGLTTPVDIAMEPGCQTILVSDIGVNKVFRINLATHAVTTLYNGPDKIQGLTYDNLGNLFANDDQLNAIVQINTTTGVIENQTPSGSPMTALEGLTYDPYTQELFATSTTGQVLYEVATTLATVTPIPFTTEPTLHGIVSNGQGNLYIVGTNGTTSYLLQYTISTGIEKTLNKVPGLEDMAPIPFGPCPKAGGVSAEACGGI
jgi:sugar lactone lactonase YvrE